MERNEKIALAGSGVAAAVVLLVVFVIGLPGGNASVVSTQSPNKMDPGQSKELCVKVKNDRPVTTNYMVEMGVIPTDVAENWFPSVLAVFGKSKGTECCSGQDNIQDRFISMGPYEEKEICVSVTAPFSGIEDNCGTTEYWDGKGDYKSYFLVSNHCNYREGEEQKGFELYDVEIKSVQVGQKETWNVWPLW